MLDTATIEKGSLTLRKRSLMQGPVAIHVEFSSGDAVGTRNMNGEEQPISVELDGPLFGDAAGAYLVIGCLPLAPGYATAFRNFDLKKQKAKVMQIQVAGPESVTVPAGTFDAFRVELSSADGGPDKSTVWISKDTRAASQDIQGSARSERSNAYRRAVALSRAIALKCCVPEQVRIVFRQPGFAVFAARQPIFRERGFGKSRLATLAIRSDLPAPCP